MSTHSTHTHPPTPSTEPGDVEKAGNVAPASGGETAEELPLGRGDAPKPLRVPEIPSEWYHRHFQAVGRAQSRYLLLLLTITAYSIGLSFTSTDTVGVTFLGLSNIPKDIVNAAAMLVLGVLLLAFYGALQAATQAFDDLKARLAADPPVQMRHVDEHPNVADFLSYASFVDGKPRRWTRYLVFVLYPLPVLGVVVWTLTLWSRALLHARTLNPRWLVWVYGPSALLMIAILWATAIFLRGRRKVFREQRPKSTSS